MSIPRGSNIGLDVAEYLSARWGFEHAVSSAIPAGTFRLRLDKKHAVVVAVSPWAERPPGGGTGASFIFGVARRDINELSMEVIGSINEPWRATVREGPAFFGRPHVSWSSGFDRDEMRAWCDVWVDRLVHEAASLPWIVAYMETDPAPSDTMSVEAHAKRVEKHHQRMRIPRMLNRMLDGGWNDVDDELFLAPMRAEVASLDPEHFWHQTLSRRLSAIQEWIADHPDGAVRDLTDEIVRPRQARPGISAKGLLAAKTSDDDAKAVASNSLAPATEVAGTELNPTQVRRLVAMLRSPSRTATDGELEAFYRPTGVNAVATLGSSDALVALRDYVSQQRVGLWLDAGDAELAAAAISEVIAVTVGVPDSAFRNTESDYADFMWDGDGQVEDVLDQFAEWLEYDNEYRRLEELHHQPAEVVEKELRHLQLVDIRTGGDYYLAVLQPACDVDEFTALLAEAGISSVCL